MKHINRNILLALILTMTTANTHAQNTFDDYLKLFEKRFDVLHELIFNETAKESDAKTEFQFSARERVREVDEQVNRNIDLLKSQTGLTATGQAYYRPVSSSVTDIDEQYGGYNSRWQVGIEWNYFQSALYKNASRIHELRLKGELEQLNFQSNNLQNILQQQDMAAKNRYHGLLLNVLQIHSENLDLLSRTQVFLLKNGKLSSDDLLKVMNEKAEIDNKLTSMRCDTSIIPVQSRPQPDMIAVNREMLKQHISLYNKDVRKIELEKEMLQCQYNDVDYWKTTSISPFVRYSYYTRPDISDTHSLDVGISVRLPLSSETKKQRNAIKAEQELKEQYQQDVLAKLLSKVDEIIRDIDVCNATIAGEYARMAEVKEYINGRTESYKNVAGEYNHIDRLQEYDMFLSAWERMLDYQYQRDSKLIELQGFVIDKPIEDFLIRKQ